MKKRIAIVTVILSALYTTATLAADVGLPAQTDDRYCSTCHGVEGRGNVGVQAPRLAGMESWYLKHQLENFRAGIRGSHEDDDQGQEMLPMATKLSDASIADIVDWINGWEYVPAEISLEGDVSKGRSAYQNCTSCHGVNGEGIEALAAPALAGQNDWYLVTQLKNFRAGIRGSHEDDSYGAQMVAMAGLLADDQAILDVVSFINTLQK